MSTVDSVVNIMPTNNVINWANRIDHYLARWGFSRNNHRVQPGLYAIGNPTQKSPVFVSANYSLSFDALRSVLGNDDSTRDCYILVLDTKGVNVWCAAGKGTFGTDELVNRIEKTGLANIVEHRRLILPQLGAPGVAAHEVKERSGFKVRYGPVRARDLPEYMQNRKATPEMRTVRFSLWDRLILVPVEVVGLFIPMLVIAGILFLIGSPLGAESVIAAILAGIVVFPILLPWIPTHDFSSKGYLVGALAVLPFALITLASQPASNNLLAGGYAIGMLLTLPTMTAFLSLNFTGSTTFTSKTGVRREIFTYGPIMAWTFVFGIVLLALLKTLEITGVF